MSYIVIDLEFNQPFDFPTGAKTLLEPECPFEIIQIGAVKMDEQFNIIKTADFLIKPLVYNRLHPYVKKITGLDMDILENCKTFLETYPCFVEFAGQNPYIFCCWGGNDINALFKNIQFHRLNPELISSSFINVQSLASQKLNNPAGMNIGLKNAVEHFGIETNMPFHYALNDALYTAKIFKIVKKEIMNIQNFSFTTDASKKNYALNAALLYMTLEQELGYKLSKKEKRIFRKVYYMGRSKKFDT